MKALGFLAVLVCCAVRAEDIASPVAQMVTTKQIGDATIDKWFSAAREWADGRDFPEEIRRFCPEILPVLVDCFDDQIMDERLSAVPFDKRKDEIDRVRISAMYCFMAMGTNASSAVPEIIRHLEDRSSTGRGILVNAIINLGVSSTNMIPVALVDLKSDAPATKQQGVLVLYAAAKFSDVAVTSLIRATDDSSELVRHTAIYALFKIMEFSQRAKARLEEIRDPANRHRDSFYVQIMFRQSKESWVGGPRVR